MTNTAQKERERETKRRKGGEDTERETETERERKQQSKEGEEGREGERREAGSEVIIVNLKCTFITCNPPHADLLRPLSLASFGRSSTRCAASVKSSHSATPLGSMADALCGSSAAQQGPSVCLSCSRLCSGNISAAASPWCVSWPRQACSSSAKYRSAMADWGFDRRDTD